LVDDDDDSNWVTEDDDQSETEEFSEDGLSRYVNGPCINLAG